MNAVEIGIQNCPLEAYFGSLVNSGLFAKALAAVLDNNVPRYLTHSLHKENVFVASQYLNIISRIALKYPALLIDYIRQMDPDQDVFPQFLDKWAGQRVADSSLYFS
jgi:hypothetical protein